MKSVNTSTPSLHAGQLRQRDMLLCVLMDRAVGRINLRERWNTHEADGNCCFSIYEFSVFTAAPVLDAVQKKQKKNNALFSSVLFLCFCICVYKPALNQIYSLPV